MFVNIADDEAEHVKTMASCQDPEVIVRAPNAEGVVLASAAVVALAAKVVDSAKLEEIDAGEMATKVSDPRARRRSFVLQRWYTDSLWRQNRT